MPAPEYKIVYLTGPPASGKSTLGSALAQSVHPLMWLSYSRMLSEHLAARGRNVTHDRLRSESSSIISADDINAVDASMIQLIEENKWSTHIIIDSHAVSRERYGYRATLFDLDKLRRLAISFVVCLYAPPEVICQRIVDNHDGRPLITLYEADFHTYLQAEVALNYGLICQVPVYFLDSQLPVEDLVQEVRRRLVV